MTYRDPDVVPRRIIDAVLVVVLLVSVGAYWKAYVDPRPAPAVQQARVDTPEPEPVLNVLG